MTARGFLLGLLTAALIAVGLRLYKPATTQTPPPPSVPMQAPPPEPVPISAGTALELSEEEQQRIGLQTAEVRMQRIEREIVAPARVQAPETALHAVSARIGGRIDKLLVNFTGQTVHEGQAIASIYSPQIFTAAEEYKLALENRESLRSSKVQEAVEQANSLIAASRRRLELWGLTADQIASLSSSSETPLHIFIYSPVAGVVTKRVVAEGQYVQEGDVLFEVTDLGSVWVVADVYPFDIDHVHVGQSAAIHSDDGGRVALRGKVTLIEPTGNPESRTIPVRIEVANERMRLKPGMIVQVTMRVAAENVLSVPRSAVIDTGKEKIVYVASGNGIFERRVIETGIPNESDYPVLSGLKAGERVVTHGAFLIDSQSRLTGGMAGMFGGSKEFSSSSVPSSEFKINFRIEPNPPKGGEDNKVHVAVADASGKPVTDADVKVTVIMPAMPSMGMPEMRASGDLKVAGSEYAGTIRIPMAGPWNVVVEVRRGGRVIASYRTRFDAV